MRKDDSRIKNRIIHPLTAVLFIALSLCVLTCCKADDREITSYDQLAEPGTRIGIGIDTPEEVLLRKDYPDARFIAYLDTQLAYADVANGRIDAFVYGRRPMELAIENGTRGVRLLDDNYTANQIGVGLSPLSPIPDLQARINEFIAEIRADGTLDDMYDRWVLQGDETMPDIPTAEDPLYHLRVATVGTEPPYTYYKGTQLNGYDIELAKRFAAWLDADLEFKIYDFGGIIAGATTGDVDCIMSNLYYNKEHAEAIPYSDTLYEVEIAAMVRDLSSSAKSGLWSGIKESFNKTFIREDRWKLFVSGIMTTILITLLSIIFGTVLGFCVFMLCRNGEPVANGITRFCVWLVQGMPAVVLLMILYYIVLGSINISGTIVSIIAFTLVFSAAVYSGLKAGVGAIGIGQLEAAYTLGYTNRRAYYRVMLPQAMPHFMPAYRNEVTQLIKATAVVGYVAVQDVTKVGDIIRGRTYDAFFPLISVAVIYFIIAAIMIAIVKKIELKIDPRQRTMDQIREEVEGK